MGYLGGVGNGMKCGNYIFRLYGIKGELWIFLYLIFFCFCIFWFFFCRKDFRLNGRNIKREGFLGGMGGGWVLEER